MRIIVPSCETAVSSIPEWYRHLFKNHEDALRTQDGWSPGALNLAQGLAMKKHVPVIHAEMSRLVVDLNKHPDDPARWSRFSEALTEEQKAKVEERQRAQHLDHIKRYIESALQRGNHPVHLSFDTRPNMGATAVTFVYDKRRESEAAFVHEWRSSLPELFIQEETPPERDLGTYLRGLYNADFASVRIIANQDSFLEGRPLPWKRFKDQLIAATPR